MTETLAVEAAQLVKRYTGRGGSDVEVVRGVDLAVRAGEVFGFLGPNGAGKSATVRMLTTLVSITSGTARVAGIDVAAEPDAARRKIGVAMQEAGLDERVFLVVAAAAAVSVGLHVRAINHHD
jgi:ABC-2 type transport system ATP-binding protein